MGERIVKFQQRLSFKPTATPGHQVIPTLIVEDPSLKAPPEALLLGRGTELQATFTHIRFEEPTKTRLGSHDLEKGLSERHAKAIHNVLHGHSKIVYFNPQDDGDEDRPKEHAIWILIYLSALSPLLALPIALYAMLIGTLLLLLLSLCFWLKPSPICARFHQLLSPLLVFQLGLIYSSYGMSEPVQTETSGIMMLALVSLLSPLYSMAIAVATWVAGAFWFYTAILGNPDGKEDRDDGREAVLAVRGWWERWLIQSLKPTGHSPLQDNDLKAVAKT